MEGEGEAAGVELENWRREDSWLVAAGTRRELYGIGYLGYGEERGEWRKLREGVQCWLPAASRDEMTSEYRFMCRHCRACTCVFTYLYIPRACQHTILDPAGRSCTPVYVCHEVQTRVGSASMCLHRLRDHGPLSACKTPSTAWR